MKFYFENHHRHSIRLSGYDYSQPGIYFVTFCCYEKQCFFGEIENQRMSLSPIGQIAKKCWLAIPEHFPDVKLDKYVIMPNHIHIIIIINDCAGGVCGTDFNVNHYEHRDRRRGGVTPPLPVPTDTFLLLPQTPPINYHPTLGQIVGYFKYQTTKQINLFRNTPGLSVWQRNYYEHIIRDESELNRIREYIRNNPINWQNDRNNTDKNI